MTKTIPNLSSDAQISPNCVIVAVLNLDENTKTLSYGTFPFLSFLPVISSKDFFSAIHMPPSPPPHTQPVKSIITYLGDCNSCQYFI